MPDSGRRCVVAECCSLCCNAFNGNNHKVVFAEVLFAIMIDSIIVVAPTFYASKNDIRYELAKECCREAAKAGIHLLLVDASPGDEFARELIDCGTIGAQGFVSLRKQTGQGRKGAALREGIAYAADLLKESGGFIAFQEPEKVDMISKWQHVVEFMLQEKADICNPRRSRESFFRTYPIEQWHSEQFANLYLDSLGKKVGFPSVDWTMGPIAFNITLAGHWLKYEGELWDAQIVPMVQAQRWYGAKVVSYEVDYIQPLTMKDDEEGEPKWSEKRLYQLNVLFECVGNALKQNGAPAQLPSAVTIE